MRELVVRCSDYQEPFRETVKRNLDYILIVISVFFIAFIAVSTSIMKYKDIQIKRQELNRNVIAVSNIQSKLQKMNMAEVLKRTIREKEIIENIKIAISKEKVLKGTEEIVEIISAVERSNYNPTEAEIEDACKLIFAEAGVEDIMGQILALNAVINNMKNEGYNSLTEEIYYSGRYSSVENGQIYNCGKVVENSDIPQEIKAAVNAAFRYDYSENMLKEKAMSLGITDEVYWKGGANYFYNPKEISEEQLELRKNIKVRFKHGNHIFYCYWDE